MAADDTPAHYAAARPTRWRAADGAIWRNDHVLELKIHNTGHGGAAGPRVGRAEYGDTQEIRRCNTLGQALRGVERVRFACWRPMLLSSYPSAYQSRPTRAPGLGRSVRSTAEWPSHQGRIHSR